MLQQAKLTQNRNWQIYSQNKRKFTKIKSKKIPAAKNVLLNVNAKMSKS